MTESKRFNDGLKEKGLEEVMLVMRYDNSLDNRFDAKLEPRWEGPYEIMKKFDNGSYWLQDLSGKVHKTRVNGWRLKLYHCRVKVDSMRKQQQESQLELEA